MSTLGEDAYAFVAAVGDGTLGLSFDLGVSAGFTGTETYEGSGDDCPDDYSNELMIPVVGFQGSATPSADTFTSSGEVDQAYFLLPNAQYAVFHVSWNLRLVRR